MMIRILRCHRQLHENLHHQHTFHDLCVIIQRDPHHDQNDDDDDDDGDDDDDDDDGDDNIAENLAAADREALQWSPGECSWS